MIVVDTGPLVALVSENDQHNKSCSAWFLETDPRQLIIPAPVLAEVCYHIGGKFGPEVESTFLEDLADGSYGTVVNVTTDDMRRMSVLVRQYGDLSLGGTDACVIAVAERLRIHSVATVDRRHFSVVRPAHVAAFDLLPVHL